MTTHGFMIFNYFYKTFKTEIVICGILGEQI